MIKNHKCSSRQLYKTARMMYVIADKIVENTLQAELVMDHSELEQRAGLAGI